MWIHLHVPKTGGTSWVRGLRMVFEGRVAQYAVQDFPLARYDAEHPEIRAFLHRVREQEPLAITGHMPYGIEGDYVTVLRQPVQRAWSYLAHSFREVPLFDGQVFLPGPAPEDWAAMVRKHRPVSVASYQSRMILGDVPADHELTREDGERAFDKLRTTFVVAGRFEQLDRVWTRFSDLLPCRVPLSHLNKGVGTLPLAPVLYEALWELNAADLRLWELFCSELDPTGAGWVRGRTG